ncbi:epididymal sperm-binding protein 1-like [Tachyglossus aculeatus]|uniref:epididymal sperm-binding protein 1-like n=1 Tax=Tachyglossus aculeatus TaxID=9261 RepID=UPI0018F34FBE|nr:epididymal sperm-binding protein 1-like [Tachyglossus aculeatus]
MDHLVWGCLLFPLANAALGSKHCHFPYIYQGKLYLTCNQGLGWDHWCGITDNFDRDGKWIYCLQHQLTPCVFPFVYENEVHTTCIKTGAHEGRAWCGTTSNFDQDRQWRLCGQQVKRHSGRGHHALACSFRDEFCKMGLIWFPFYYNRTIHYDCITLHRNKPWCYTTTDYNTDQKWAYC